MFQAQAASLPERYAGLGELILTPLESAPFPHPSRAQGHQYHDQFFNAADHYSDSTVAVFIPKGFKLGARLDVVVHFHGWNNHVEKALTRYQLPEQLAASGRNLVLVVPQGPRDASDSGGGRLEDPGAFARFMQEVLRVVGASTNVHRQDLTLGRIILSAHSGGYQVVSSILDHGGLTDHIEEVWLYDALYAQTDRFLAWLDASHGRLLSLYTEHGGTKGENEQFLARLKARGTEAESAREAGVQLEELRRHPVWFLFTDLAHDDVLDQHQLFRLVLQASPDPKP